MESIASSHCATDFTFKTSILNASSPSRSTHPDSSQPQFSISAMQSVLLDQDPREVEWRNCTESKPGAIVTEEPEVAHNENKAVLHGAKLWPDETISAMPNWSNLDLSNLMSRVKEAWPDLFQADDMQVPPVSEMHADEVLGGATVVDVMRFVDPNPVSFCKKTPAPEKEEKRVEPIQSEKIEVKNAELDSRPEEIEQKSNEVVELKSDPKLDVDLLDEIVREIYNLHLEVKARREWAQEKALQAAIKVSNDSLELRTLRTKREMVERMKKNIKTKQDKLVTLMDEMVQMAKTTQERADSAQMEVTRFEKENQEMRAEIEAAKLEKSEIDNKCKRLEKMLKRINKDTEMSERQMLVLQGEVNKAKKDNAEIGEQIEEVRREISASEAKLEEEKKLKQQAVKLIEAEHKAVESAKKSTQTRLTILARKLDLDRRRHNEQVQILECLKKANSSSAHNNLPKLHWPCIACKAAEASVVFLPCAHQVVCAECGKAHIEIGSEKCPCCRVRVDERIFVYGLGV